MGNIARQIFTMFGVRKHINGSKYSCHVLLYFWLPPSIHEIKCDLVESVCGETANTNVHSYLLLFTMMHLSELTVAPSVLMLSPCRGPDFV